MTQQFAESLAGEPPIHTLSPAEARSFLERAQSAPVGKPIVRVQELTCPSGPAGPVRLRILRPGRSNGVLPVVMYFHGGGWVLGDAGTHDRLVREIAVEAGAALVFVDYDRAPEAQYPTAIEQAYAATQHVVRPTPGSGRRRGPASRSSGTASAPPWPPSWRCWPRSGAARGSTSRCCSAR